MNARNGSAPRARGVGKSKSSLHSHGSAAKKKKKSRSTQEQMRLLIGLVRQTCDEVRDGGTVTLRQLFYALTVRGILDKAESQYKRLATLTSAMRKGGELPYEWLEDSTRITYVPDVYDSPADALRELSEDYAVSPWPQADWALEIWLEKDALAGPVYDVTYGYCVPLRVQRGYASLSASYKAAKDIATRAERGQPTQVYYLRDFDPSGADAARASEEAVGHILISDFDLDPSSCLDVEILGVTEEQIEEWNLPTRPTKSSDTRAAGFGSSRSVELDAIPPANLRQLVEDAILEHLPEQAMEIKKAEEESTRSYLATLARALKRGE